MLEIILERNETFLLNSDVKSVDRNSTYTASTKVLGLQCKPFSACFGVVFLDKNNNEVNRKVKFLTSTNTEVPIHLTFKAESEKIVLMYRANIETPVTSRCHFKLLPLEEVCIVRSQSALPENWDNLDELILPFNELEESKELELENNIAWIFALGRSGTTWLSQLLGYATEIMYEPFISGHLGLRNAPLKGKPRRIDHGNTNPDYFFSKFYQKGWLFFLRKMILNRLHSEFSESTKIIVKEPGWGAPDIISKALPFSKIIILLRDGRDVIDSMLDSRSTTSAWAAKDGQFIISNEQDRLNFITQAASDWSRYSEILINTYENHSQDRRILIKYEDLRTNTYVELKRLYEFLGINISHEKLTEIIEKFRYEKIPEDQKGRGKFVRFAQPGKWKENFSNQEKQIMKPIMDGILTKLGYESF